MPEQPSTVSNPAATGWSRSIERLSTATAGRFTIIRELGRGGFAVVFLAQQHKPSRRVAIKLLLPVHLESQWVIDHFRGESQKIAAWRHQSVVTIYEVHEVEDLLYFVMSYVEGGSLNDVIQTAGPLPVATIRSVLAQVGSAIHYAHRQGVLHRDIKPHNVLIDVDGGAVVTDFGIAKDMEGPSNTVLGTLVGTAPYMSPEQCAESGRATFASDQYALGIVAYEALTGAPPFVGSLSSVCMAHIQTAAPSIRERRPDCPPELEAAVLRMLAKDPTARFPNVREAIAAAGAAELPEYDADRQALAMVARRIAARSEAPVLDVASIPPFLEVGDEVPLDAKARTVAGDLLSDIQISWAVTDSGIAQVDSARGTLTALAPGLTTMFVRAGGVEQAVEVEVRSARVTSLRLLDLRDALRIGDERQTVAEVLGKHGTPVEARPEWRSDDPRVVTINPEGVIRAHGEGRARIIAVAGEVTSELWVTVLPPHVAEVRVAGIRSALIVGDTAQLGIVVLDATGQPLGDRTVRWSSSDRRVATVSDAGLVTASAIGSVTITAECEGCSGAAALEVREPSATSISLSAAQGTLYAGATLALSATVRDARGRVLDRPVVWRSSDPAVAVVWPDGTITGRDAGETTVTAIVDGVESNATITVVARPTPATVTAPARVPERMPLPPAREDVEVAPIEPPKELVREPARELDHEPVSPVDQRETAEQRATRILRVSAGVLAGLLVLAAVIYFLARRADSGDRASVDSTAVSTTVSTTTGAGPSTTGTGGSTSTVVGRDSVGRPIPDEQPKLVPAVTPIAVRVSRSSVTIAADSSVTLRATVTGGRAGAPAEVVRWRSSDESRATVSQRGRVRALRPGTVRIIAGVGDRADTAMVTVTPRARAGAPGAPIGRTSTRPGAKPELTPKPTPQELVGNLLRNYKSAIESGQLQNIAGLYSSLPDAERVAWERTFGKAKDRRVAVTMQLLGPINVVGSAATARVFGIYSYENKNNRACNAAVNLTLAFAETPAGWRITRATTDRGRVIGRGC